MEKEIRHLDAFGYREVVVGGREVHAGLRDMYKVRVNVCCSLPVRCMYVCMYVPM